MNLQEKIREYQKENKLSQSAVAKLLGISEATISRWLKGDYPNPETIDKKVEELLNKETQREYVNAGQLEEFADTNISNQVWGVLDYCRLKRVIGCIYGDAGVGKTKTAEEWSRDKSDVVFITAAPAFSGPKPFLKQLAKELKSAKVGQLDDIYSGIVEKLRGTDKTIIIDEAQHLTLKTVEHIRSLNDDKEAKTAIIFIGNEIVYNKLLGRQQAEFAQLFSRIGMKKHLSTDQFNEDDVKKVFGVDDKERVGLLLGICKTKFGLRGAVFVYENAINNGDNSFKGLIAMAKMMGIIL